MSCKQRSEISFFLFVVTAHLLTFRVCRSVSLGQRQEEKEGLTSHQVQDSNASRWERIKHDTDVQQGNWRLVEKVIRGPYLSKSNWPGLAEPRLESVASPGDSDSKLALNSLFWTSGHISRQPESSSQDPVDGYQADSTDFDGVQGKVLGPSFDSSSQSSEWLAMRPLVQCDDNVMTLTTSGEALAHLLVDREGASPISLFHLPSYCGYTVTTSRSDLQMMVSYDACYITQENGSYVLPMLWWGSPLKLACPVKMATPAPSYSPSVFCSTMGMVVQIKGQEQDIAMLGVIVNGGWRPFVFEDCAHRVPSDPGELTFFSPTSAPCITHQDGLHLQLVIDDHQYILSCPANPHSSPGDPQFPYIPDPVISAPTFPLPPEPPTQEQITQLPHYPYPGFQYPQLPQVYLPGPQPAHPPRPTPGSPPGSQQQQQQQQQLPYHPPMEDVVTQAPSFPNLSPEHDTSPYLVSKLPVGPSQYQFGAYYPFYYPAVTPAPIPATETPTTTAAPPAKHPASPYQPQYYQIPYHPAPTAAPVTQAPAPLPPSPPKQHVAPQYPVGQFYPPDSYYHYGHFPYPKPDLEPAPVSHPTVTSPPTPNPMIPKHPSYPFDQFYPQEPIYFQSPTFLPSAKQNPQAIPQELQKPAAPQSSCPHHPPDICGYYPYPYFPYYYPLYPPHCHPPYHPAVPQYPQTPPPMTKKPFITTGPTPATPTTVFIPTEPTKQNPHLRCLNGRMVVFLPFAHRDSIQVRDPDNTWLFLSSVSPLCGYLLQKAEDSGVIFQSPLPACHSEPRTPTTVSLPLRFWDLSIAQYRTLDLQCPHQATPMTPAPVTPPVFPTPPWSTMGKSILPDVPKPKVLCSSDQMTVELPSGPISGIFVKDIKGNQMNLQDAPKHCGYSARKGKDGKIHLSLQLHSNCHMSVQGKMHIITVVYMAVNGRREARLFCPLLVPGSGKECNLPSEQRLPCGPGSVSQPQCLSMGCCFSKQPPACYYPMDECTLDRHFVFSVPTSLTEPPLSPSLLVAAGNSTCKPQRVTTDYAFFKIPMDGCGTRRVMVGKAVIYMVEIVNKVQALSLNYGTITRDSPVRLLVECRYLPSTVLSVSYMVKSPTLGPVHTQGVFGVQLRIAKDSQYTSYYPQYHQPLQMLLGKPLYLEVRLLNTPDPSLVLLVHYCVAYPRSGKAVWLLLYNGCPNPYDPAPQQAVVLNPQPPTPRAQTRRFTISTFQFLPDGEFKDPTEEIYFMCSTEICSPRDGPCVEGCFGQ
ncbi:uncharacterized protein LOC119027879 isoform X2 [Acanthopagrus latus]|uniref:uncharacterized protein LOC119027879 isoform X2 n=1 Tax=Acanthopagrus latus TaxID=8177 RepID=UPI00187C4291|nr:uncharacterized protein LOC119027879 isoform X2 [Acanthopagrus latus]